MGFVQTLNMQYRNCLIIFACLLETVLAGNSTTAYKIKPIFSRKTCKSQDSVFSSTDVPTSLTCSSICASDVDCESFFYFPSSLRCDGCKQTYSAEGQLTEAGERTVHYSTKVSDVPFEYGLYEYEHLGCYSVLCNSGQSQCESLMDGFIREITPEKCFQSCEAMSGVHVSSIALQMESCFCAQRYDRQELGCNEPCSGNKMERCGGTNLVSVYELP